jgi:polyhydroxyalkanoate synthase
MHSFYLRNMYHMNLLAKRGGLQLSGVPIDLTQITTPTFILSAREDHIAPWKSTYAGAAVRQGSWWPIWHEWVTGFASGRIPARQPGDGRLPVIEDAPGSYARMRSEA